MGRVGCAGMVGGMSASDIVRGVKSHSGGAVSFTPDQGLRVFGEDRLPLVQVHMDPYLQMSLAVDMLNDAKLRLLKGEG